MTNDDADQTRPDFAEIATKVTDRYPNVLADLAERERQEQLERTDETDGEETPEERRS